MTQENSDCKPDETPENADAVPESNAQSEPDAAETPEETYTLTRSQMERMEEAAKELATLKDQYLRQAAEYDNYRKRTVREKETL